MTCCTVHIQNIFLPSHIDITNHICSVSTSFSLPKHEFKTESRNMEEEPKTAGRRVFLYVTKQKFPGSISDSIPFIYRHIQPSGRQTISPLRYSCRRATTSCVTGGLLE